MEFTLRIFQSEYEQLEKFVLKYPSTETGGDLFGLWSDDGDAVVQLLIGPGQNCRRTSTSFHQDVSYLARVGTFVNSSYMLCHLGSWHSHHQLSLTQPSAGDRSTVRNNFPRGLKRYIMVIANIQRSTSRFSGHTVVIHPYMFTSEGYVCLAGRVSKILETSPFRHDLHVSSILSQGAERVVSTRSDYQNFTEFIRSRPQVDYLPPKAPSYRRFPIEKQWYETEKGGEKLKGIHQMVQACMASSVNYSRHKESKDLTMEFYHNHCRWLIKFPGSFNGDQVIVEKDGSQRLLSGDVVEGLKRYCGCASCKPTNACHKLSSSREDSYCQLPSLPSTKLPYSLTLKQPTPPPKSSHFPTKNHLRMPSKVSSRVPSKSSMLGKRFYYRDKHGFDDGNEQWYESDKGEKRLKRIYHDISELDGSLRMSRLRNSKDIHLEFVYNGVQWRIDFPFNYPQQIPDIKYLMENGCFHSIEVFKDTDIVKAIKTHCSV